MFDIQKEWQNRIKIIAKILQDSSQISLSGFSKNPGAQPTSVSSKHKKSFKDIVTEFDQKVEDFIVAKLKENFPGEAILGEEGAYLLKSRPNDETFSQDELVWVLDPIDGTANYSKSYPYFCTTVALLQNISGRFEVVLAATLDPTRNELFYAAKGMGAYMNQEKISVSSSTSLETCMFVTGFASDIQSEKDILFKRFTEMTRKSMGVRRSGAAALDLAYVAIGRLDAFWECSLSVWDIAAGSLLVKEAGGIVSHFERDIDWNPWTGEILACSKNMHAQVLAELKSIKI